MADPGAQESGGGGGGLRRVGPAPKTDKKCKSKDKYYFHLSFLVV